MKIQDCKKITTLDYTLKLFNHQARLHQVCVAAQMQGAAALGRQEAVGGVLEYQEVGFPDGWRTVGEHNSG